MSSLAGKQGPRYRHATDDGAPYETIAVEKLTPIIGAEISGVDIGKLVSDDARSNRQMDEVHRALPKTSSSSSATSTSRHNSISPSAASSVSCISIPPRRMRMKTRP